MNAIDKYNLIKSSLRADLPEETKEILISFCDQQISIIEKKAKNKNLKNQKEAKERWAQDSLKELVLSIIEEAPIPLTAKEVANKIEDEEGNSPSTALVLARLFKLVEEGEIKKKAKWRETSYGGPAPKGDSRLLSGVENSKSSRLQNQNTYFYKVKFKEEDVNDWILRFATDPKKIDYSKSGEIGSKNIEDYGGPIKTPVLIKEKDKE